MKSGRDAVKIMTAVRAAATEAPLSWSQWQLAVLAILNAEFAELVGQCGSDEVDWPAWRVFYDQGRGPAAAINRALERDF